jgi:anti-anti-sigma regulatory factor
MEAQEKKEEGQDSVFAFHLSIKDKFAVITLTGTLDHTILDQIYDCQAKLIESGAVNCVFSFQGVEDIKKNASPIIVKFLTALRKADKVVRISDLEKSLATNFVDNGTFRKEETFQGLAAALKSCVNK